jgi:hypothetical protein
MSVSEAMGRWGGGIVLGLFGGGLRTAVVESLGFALLGGRLRLRGGVLRCRALMSV